MYLHEKAEIIFKGKSYKADFLRKQIEEMKFVIGQALKEERQPVAIALDRSPELIISIFALLEMKIPFLPVDMEQPKERLLRMLERAEVTHIITKEENLCFQRFKTISYPTGRTGESPYNPYKNIKYASEVAYVLFTSGSTGEPKAVEVTRKGLANFIEGMSEVIDFREGKALISLTTHTFDIFFLESILALSKGMHVVLAAEDERKNPRRIEELIVRYDVEMVQMTPSTMQLLYFYERELKYLKNVKEIMLGGETLPMRLLENLQNLTTARIYNLYGPTETTIWSAVADLTEEKEVHIGKPIKNTKIHVLGESLHPVADGEMGEICIEGDGLAKGYKNNEFLTKQAFVYLENGVRVYRTGDYGIINEAGKLKCLGRKDDQIKILGHRVELEDIDNNIRLCPEIWDCATCFEKETEQLITFYMSERELGYDRLKAFLSEKLPSHMIPGHFKKVQELKYNSNGKLDRKGLLEGYYKNSTSGSISSMNYRKNYESKVLQIVTDCMEYTEGCLSKEMRIEDLQWNSLTYVRIIVALEEEFGISFDTECLTSTYFSTISELEEYIYTKKDRKGGNYHYGKSCGTSCK